MPRWSEADLSASGVSLHVRQGGKGAAVLLLHGFPDSGRLWSEVAPLLVAGGYRVIIPDLRGFGRSEAPPEVRDYTLGHVVSDLRTIVTKLNGGAAVHVIGHDWGAVAGWGLALEHPHLVTSQVAISVGHPREYVLAGIEQKLKGLYTLGWQVPGISELWLRRGNFAALRSWARRHPQIERCIRDLSRPGRLTAGLNWYRANLGRMLFGPWPDCTVPTLGLWSDRDCFLAEDQMRQSERRMGARWRYERVQGVGHWVPLERPDLVASMALEWFGQPAD
jgi:pimeloyl-ACP methyl ester carboxylesterase